MNDHHKPMTRYPYIDPRWTKGPRVRIDTMRKGARFVSIEGEVWVYERLDGALSGAHHVKSEDGAKSAVFAGCAEGVLL
jgi:hypothetical protein